MSFRFWQPGLESPVFACIGGIHQTRVIGKTRRPSLIPFGHSVSTDTLSALSPGSTGLRRTMRRRIILVINFKPRRTPVKRSPRLRALSIHQSHTVLQARAKFAYAHICSHWGVQSRVSRMCAHISRFYCELHPLPDLLYICVSADVFFLTFFVSLAVVTLGTCGDLHLKDVFYKNVPLVTHFLCIFYKAQTDL